MRPESIGRRQWWNYNLLFLLDHFLGHRKYGKWLGGRERRLLQRVEAQVRQGREEGRFHIEDLPKGTWTDPLYDHYLPKVFRGAAADWPCAEKWDLDYFVKTYGDTRVNLIDNPGLVGKSDQHNEEVSLAEYIAMLKQGTNKYLKFSRLVHDNSVLMADMDADWLRRFKSAASFGDLFYFFIGARGTNTPLHNGFSRTVFVQVRGSKKWVFYAPGERIFLGVRPERTNYYYSNADIDAPDDPAYPLLRYARRFEVEVHEGDVIYIPPLVWHQVENLTETVGVAYKFADIPSAFRSSKMMALLYFFSTKPYFFDSTGHLWKKTVYGKEKTI